MVLAPSVPRERLKHAEDIALQTKSKQNPSNFREPGRSLSVNRTKFYFQGLASGLFRVTATGGVPNRGSSVPSGRERYACWGQPETEALPVRFRSGIDAQDRLQRFEILCGFASFRPLLNGLSRKDNTAPMSTKAQHLVQLDDKE
ncbi:hypothetical protein J7T55_011476 [Diaporthe amygdali]|uniref:uncharacterized protein n=1 Tax=Phomopsis amygdali TaxID=1214568 RepID=UPI0022FF3BBA|nr:uncharacterized protein J7T55_011476 [Diaporthe amygdali]KAJ0123014.1 hypothetical protein J7T55_011476 [Diaporthe amygdali]